MPYFLALDAGGTRTVAWLADERRVVARGIAGPCNPAKTGLHAAQQALQKACRRPLRWLSGRKIGVMEVVCAGLAGVGRPTTYRPMMDALKRTVPAKSYHLLPDAAIAFQAALGSESGILVISGTGSIGFARDESGGFHRCGGWGATFDDAGSGYDIGRKAVAAALQSFDGRGLATRLEKDLCKALRLRDPTHIVDRALTPAQIAGLFPLVEKAARRGDQVAQMLLWEAGSALSHLALALVTRLRWKRRKFPVVCAGGVFKGSATVYEAFASFVQGAAPGAKVSLLRREPVEGALELARILAHKVG